MKVYKALVIDDEQVVLDSVEKILKEKNFSVDTSLSGKMGLQLAVEGDYDIVLTDIRMPEIGGMRILRDVKRARPAMPVMIITGYATVDSAVQAMQLGASHYIAKPFTPDELLAAVMKILEATIQPEEQEIIHKEEILKVLEKAAEDTDFIASLLYNAAGALRDYNLTAAEKLAVLTGDIQWIEKYIGKLNDKQKKWLLQRLSAEIW